MVEVGLAILFLGVLIAADRSRMDRMAERLRQFIDWLERPS